MDLDTDMKSLRYWIEVDVRADEAAVIRVSSSRPKTDEGYCGMRRIQIVVLETVGPLQVHLVIQESPEEGGPVVDPVIESTTFRNPGEVYEETIRVFVGASVVGL